MPLDEFALAADMPDARPFDASDPARPALERFGTSPCSSRRLVSCVTEAPGNLAGGGTGIGTIPIGGPSAAVADVASASGYDPFARGTGRAAAGFRREARFA